MDTLGMGALLAVLRFSGGSYGKSAKRLTGLCALVGFPLYILGILAGSYGIRLWDVPSIVGDLWLGLTFVWIVERTVQGVGGPVGRVLNWRPLLYIGRISYGIYILHQFVPAVFKSCAVWLPCAYPTDFRVRFYLFTGTTFLLAATSWHCFEKPLNDLKRFFPYRRCASRRM
jgi:peptidoglycan/LPS O-acetylase OafA/YrhL